MSSDKDFKTVMENVIETNILYEENMAKNYFSTANNLPRNSENHKTLGNNNWFEKVSVEHTPVQEFYRGANVLVTGATGFIGKVLVEKLLRSCPDVNSIYLLVRSKRGKDVEERIEDLIASPCFDRLKTERPEFKNKLIAVAGDISNEGLGISDQDRQLLAQQVNIVFHVAATVKFDEQLNVAIKQNVRGTRDLLLLCKTFTNLKSVVHVSTAYSNCPSDYIKEEFYESPMNCDEAIKLAESVSESVMNTMTPKLIGKWPNSYSFTKAIAEDAVRKYGQNINVGIFRPAIVICTSEEPMSGWIDNMYGPTGYIVGCVSGLIRTTQCDGNKEANVVPCDLAINGLVAAAADVFLRRSHSSDFPIYNFINPASNALTWKNYMCGMKDVWVHLPISKAIWISIMIITKSRRLALFYRFLLHIFPAMLIDTGLYISGRKPQMMDVYKKIHKFSEVLSYFSTREWKFDNQNTNELWNKLSDKDKTLFPFDMSTLDWKKFIVNSSWGLRKHLLKEDPATLPEATRKANRLFWMHQALVAILFCLLSWGIISSARVISSLMSIVY